MKAVEGEGSSFTSNIYTASSWGLFTPFGFVITSRISLVAFTSSAQMRLSVSRSQPSSLRRSKMPLPRV